MGQVISKRCKDARPAIPRTDVDATCQTITKRHMSRPSFFPVIKVNRFRIYRDDCDAYAEPASLNPIRDYDVVELRADHIDDILRMPGRTLSRELLERRFGRGDCCLGVRKENTLIALLWAVFKWLHFGTYQMHLRAHEAYIIDSYVAPAYRAQGVGSCLYFKMIEHLKHRGIHTTYSVTLRNNALAVRYRERVGSRLVDSAVSVTLCNRWRVGSKARPEKLRAAE